MGDVIRPIPESERERIRLIRKVRAICDSMLPSTDVVGELANRDLMNGAPHDAAAWCRSVLTVAAIAARSRAVPAQVDAR
jgi:hypothetical protein